MSALELCTAILRMANSEMPQPRRTQLAVHLHRALAAGIWQTCEDEIDAIEREVLALRDAMAARGVL